MFLCYGHGRSSGIVVHGYEQVQSLCLGSLGCKASQWRPFVIIPTRWVLDLQ